MSFIKDAARSMWSFICFPIALTLYSIGRQRELDCEVTLNEYVRRAERDGASLIQFSLREYDIVITKRARPEPKP